ncbi:MAG TPA: methyltransferase domain-containing protein [Terriglobales bacterium]|jgi:SAM-dependent methyltransferase|nr:methyltransferase domain-containing protein [Terriglobales bacterium]
MISFAAAKAFDGVADSYDALFTHSVIGRAQRRQVWAKLLDAFPVGARILELNCGTGEDASYLAEKGRSVVACDASPLMIQVARRRKALGNSVNPEFLNLANEDLGLMGAQKPFDGAFSNFSGLNCLADLRPFASNLATLVKPGSPVLLCLWSRVCVTEFFWYLLHGQPKKACRRFAGKSAAKVGGLIIPVAYPTVGAIRRAFSPWFHLRSRCAVGLFVPPSYVEQWMSKHPKILRALERLDRKVADWPIFRDAGDHVLLELVRCN